MLVAGQPDGVAGRVVAAVVTDVEQHAEAAALGRLGAERRAVVDAVPPDLHVADAHIGATEPFTEVRPFQPGRAAIALAVFVATLTAGAVVLQPRATALLDTVPKVTQRLGRVLHGTALDRTSAIRKLTIGQDNRAERSIVDHKNIIDALARRDPVAAEQLVRDHTLGLATHIEQHGNFLD